MPLLDFQTALGRMIQGSSREDASYGLLLSRQQATELAAIATSAGFQYMVEVQRSWCKGRAAKAARLTLRTLDKGEQSRILDEWVNAGGGRSSFLASEADEFLDFIADRLPDPSHELTICRMEQGLMRARSGADSFETRIWPDMNLADCVVSRGRYASVVMFHAEPSVLLSALGKGPLPPLSACTVVVVFAPGVDGLFRIANAAEIRIWERLGEPATLHALSEEGHLQEMIKTMFREGFVDFRG